MPMSLSAKESELEKNADSRTAHTAGHEEDDEREGRKHIELTSLAMANADTNSKHKA